MSAGRGASRLRWALGLVGVVVVLLVSWTGYQALQARDALESVAADLDRLADQLTEGDEAGARRSLESAQEAAEEAERRTHGAGWWLTTRLPGARDDVRAIRTVAQATRSLTANALPGIVRAGDTLRPEALQPSGERVEIDEIADVATAVVTADRSLQRQLARVSALDAEALNPQLTGPVAKVQASLAEAAARSSRAAAAVQLMPSMLGGEEERRYLVLFQDGAEMRAAGGAVEAYAVLTADNGVLDMSDPEPTAGLRRLSSPPVEIEREERTLYGPDFGRSVQDLTSLPDHPRMAEIAKAVWEAQGGEPVDGVITLDPVAVGAMLDGSTQTLARGTTGQRVAAFRAAASDSYGEITSGTGDPVEVLAALADAATQRRLLVWSSHPSEQRLLAETRLSGGLPEGESDRPYVGVFLEDTSRAGRTVPVQPTVDVEPLTCDENGRQELRVQVELSSASSGRAGRGRPADLRVHLYTPVGGYIEEATVDGRTVPLREAPHRGHRVGSTTVTVPADGARTLTYVAWSGAEQPGDVRLRVTPGLRGDGVGTVSDPAC